MTDFKFNNETPFSSILIYAVASVRVKLPPGITDPQVAVDEACNRVDFHTLLQQSRPGNPHVEYVDWAESFSGALIDLQGDPEFNESLYVADDGASTFLEHEVQQSLTEAISSALLPLETLRSVSNTSDPALKRAALKGLIRHGESEPEERSAALRALIRLSSSHALQWLEENSDIWDRVGSESLLPALTDGDNAIREKAIRLSSHLGRKTEKKQMEAEREEKPTRQR